MFAELELSFEFHLPMVSGLEFVALQLEPLQEKGVLIESLVLVKSSAKSLEKFLQILSCQVCPVVEQVVHLNK